MKRLIILSLLSVFVLAASQNVAAQTNKNILGEWKFSSPNAPYGYDKGSIFISEKDGNLEGEIKFADGYKIDLKKVTFKENTITCNLFIDYESVNITAEIDGEKMKGNAGTSQGKMPFTAEKAK